MKSLILRDWEVRAILDGRLTQLRRVVKPQPLCEEVPENIGNDRWCGRYRVLGMDGEEIVKWDEFGPCPLGSPDDVRWVKETWCCATGAPGPMPCHYRADGDRIEFDGLWRSSVHMPRWASRITLEVVRTWVERVQEINEFDARAMGMRMRTDGPNIVASVRRQWNLDNPMHPWESNPWVWAMEVRKVEHDDEE